MNFLNQNVAVERPCKDVMASPLQCFRELFLATPALVVNLFVGVGGFVAALLIWGSILALAGYAIFFALKKVLKGARYFFTNTSLGKRISSLLPVGSYLQRFCCRASKSDQSHGKTHQSIGDLGANLVSKVSVDTKWFKNALKHNPFNRQSDKQSADNHESSVHSPSKTPQRSTSRLSALTPKILSPKMLKHS